MTGYPEEYWTRAEDLRAMNRDPVPAPGLSIVALTVAATLIGTTGLALTAWLVFA